jgi:hypothetical protein
MPMTEPEHQLSQDLSRTRKLRHRASTPLELLFDLTFTVAFGVAATHLARGLADQHVAAGPSDSMI